MIFVGTQIWEPFSKVSRTGSRCGMTFAANFSRFFLDKSWWYPNKSMDVDVVADFPYDSGWSLKLWSLLRLVGWLVEGDFLCCPPQHPTSSFHTFGSDFGYPDIWEIGSSGHVKLQRNLRCGSWLFAKDCHMAIKGDVKGDVTSKS